MSLTNSPNSLLSFNHRHVISSVSTNSELIDAIKNTSLAADELHLLTAETQSAGRGQRGRSWQSPLGNVYLSLYHPVTMPVSGLLSLIIGVELAKMPVIDELNKQLNAQGLNPIGVKWANDLGFYKTSPLSDKPAEGNTGYQINQQTDLNANNSSHTSENADQQIIYFNKLAGILIEPVWCASKLVGVVMGVGLNVQATPTLTAQTCEGMSYQALSLQDIYQQLEPIGAAPLPKLSSLYQQITNALIASISCFHSVMIEKLSVEVTAANDFMQQFNTLDALAGLRLQVTQNHNGQSQIITGTACGIDAQGCLQLRQDNGKLAALFTGRIDVIGKY